MIEADKTAEYIEAKKKELQEKITAVSQSWIKAGDVGDGVLKERVGGIMFSQARALMEKLSGEKDFEILYEGRKGMSYRLGGIEVTTLMDGEEIFLHGISSEVHRIKDFVITLHGQNNIVFFARVNEPEGGLSNGEISVRVATSVGELTEVLYDCDYSREQNVPGAFISERVEYHDGKITCGLQRAEGPPHYT